MLTVLALVGALAVLFVAAVVATRGGEVLHDAPRDAADLDLPAGALQAEDVAAVRLGVSVRGYRMSEVDHLLDRVVHDLGARDARILELEAALTSRGVGPEGQSVLPEDDAAVEGGGQDTVPADVADPEREAAAGREAVAARLRAHQAAVALEQEAAAAPPLAGRGVFLGVRVRDAPAAPLVEAADPADVVGQDTCDDALVAAPADPAAGSVEVPADEPSMDGAPFDLPAAPAVAAPAAEGQESPGTAGTAPEAAPPTYEGLTTDGGAGRGQ